MSYNCLGSQASRICNWKDIFHSQFQGAPLYHTMERVWSRVPVADLSQIIQHMSWGNYFTFWASSATGRKERLGLNKL